MGAGPPGVVVRGGQQRLSGLWVVFLGGVLQQPQSLCWLFPTVHQGFPQCAVVPGAGGLLMNSTLKSRTSWGPCPSWGPSKRHTQHPLSSHGRFGCRSGWLELPTPCFGETGAFWGHSGTCLPSSGAATGGLCVPPSPWRSWEAIETPASHCSCSPTTWGRGRPPHNGDTGPW